MDFSIKHWAPYPRRYPSVFPVINADFMTQKSDRVRNRFPTCNFSLILNGRGEYIRLGKAWNVDSPCVITQWPGEYLEYGPQGTWDELHIDYHASVMPRMQTCGLIHSEKPVWPIRDPASVNAQIAELEILSKSPTPELMVDRVDRVCERLILETWLEPPVVKPAAQSLQALLLHVRKNLGARIDIQYEAEKRGMSLATFRRRWSEITSISPAHYLLTLRMREACRLLVETNLPVNEISHTVGFEDEFYFPRRFRKEFRMPPRDYRKLYQIHRTAW